jgi:hypothetical protein
MKPMYLTIILTISSFLLSCAGNTHFVILRAVPNNPSITVVPANENLSEVEFAISVESYVLSAGVRVVHRPPTKDVLYAGRLTQSDILGSNSENNEVMTERYFPLTDAKSDYILFTYASDRRLKLVKKSSGEVLSSITLANSMGKDQQAETEIVMKNLKSAGLLKKQKK